MLQLQPQLNMLFVKLIGSFFILLFLSARSNAQEVFWPTNDYYPSNCVIRDSLREVNFHCYNSRSVRYADDCLPTYDHWSWMAYMDNQDSINTVFRKIITPVMGKLAAERMVISSINFYQDPDGREMDSEDTVYFKDYAEWCLSLAYEFQCYLMFDDSVWLPVNVMVDGRNKILNRIDLPACLLTAQSFQLMSMCEIYERVLADPYMKDEDISPYANLQYSSGLKLFYFEIESWSCTLLEETSNSSLYEMKHIFIDAHTGKILWRTTAEHYRKHSGCVIWYEITLPANSLTGD